MGRTKSIESRLKELKESNHYQEAFNKLKSQVLSQKEPQKIDFKKIEPTKGFEWKSSFFLKKFNAEDSIKLGWTVLDLIPLKQVQKILRKGNINEYWIRIPDIYSAFKEEWNLEYFVDPLKDGPKGLNPFIGRPATLKYDPKSSKDKVVVSENLNYQAEERKKYRIELIKIHRTLWGLSDRIEKYSDIEIREVKDLIDKGMNGIQIFWHKYPKWRDYNPLNNFVRMPSKKEYMKDIERQKINEWKEIDRLKLSEAEKEKRYMEFANDLLKTDDKEYRGEDDYLAWRAYIRTLRLMKRARTKLN